MTAEFRFIPKSNGGPPPTRAADQKFVYGVLGHPRQELLIESGTRFKYLLVPFGSRNALRGPLP